MSSNLGDYSLYSRLVGDVNADGRDDLIALYTGPSGMYVFTALANGNGTFAAAQGGQIHAISLGAAPYDGAYSRLLGDLDGDGAADLVAMYTGPSGMWSCTALGQGNGSFHPVQCGQLHTGDFGPYSQYSRLVGDLNADGRADLIAFYTGPSGIWAYTAIGKGDGTFLPAQGGSLSTTSFGVISAYSRLLGDANGDGKADLIAMYTGSSGMYGYAALGKGDGSFGPLQGGQLTTGDFGSFDLYTRSVVDLNGDGKADVSAFYTGGSGIYIYGFRNDPGFPDLASELSTGSGGVLSVTYKPLTDGSVYTKDSTAVYPTVDLKMPLYVVSSANRNDAIGAGVTTNYSYAGAKADHLGRGYLGFRQIRTTDAQTGIAMLQTYRQDWPYVGLPSTVTKSQSSGAILNNVANTYACANPATAAPCAVAPGSLYFPHLAQSVEAGNDLNGTTLPSVTTAMQYDSYGNATQVTVSTGDGYSKSTSNVFVNDVPSWLLGRLKSSTVQSTVP
jgi:hypothetical protein